MRLKRVMTSTSSGARSPFSQQDNNPRIHHKRPFMVSHRVSPSIVLSIFSPYRNLGTQLRHWRGRAPLHLPLDTRVL